MNGESRDRLSRLRTSLANERTLLAYVRTTLGFVIVGGPAVWWLGHPYIQALGGLSLTAGLICLALGIHRFFAVRIMIARESCRTMGRTQAEYDGTT